jgi:alcohol dehydrogenase
LFLKAAVYRGPRNIKIEDVPEPQVKDRKVLVKFKAGSICGTDMHLYRGEWKIKRAATVVVEAAGLRKTAEQTPFLVRDAGKVALIGEFQGYLNLEEAPGAWFFTTYISPVEYPAAVALLANKSLDVKGMITHKFKLAEFEKAIQTADNAAEKPLKVIITE